MPIYAYRCEECGFAKDVLQKLSDPVLTDCPQCGKSTFKKQLTAAGFQLKGSGWYVTDFRGGDKPKTSATSATPVDTTSGESTSNASKSNESTSNNSAPAAPAATPSKPSSDSSTK